MFIPEDERGDRKGALEALKSMLSESMGKKFAGMKKPVAMEIDVEKPEMGDASSDMHSSEDSEEGQLSESDKMELKRKMPEIYMKLFG